MLTTYTAEENAKRERTRFDRDVDALVWRARASGSVSRVASWPSPSFGLLAVLVHKLDDPAICEDADRRVWRVDPTTLIFLERTEGAVPADGGGRPVRYIDRPGSPERAGWLVSMGSGCGSRRSIVTIEDDETGRFVDVPKEFARAWRRARGSLTEAEITDT